MRLANSGYYERFQDEFEQNSNQINLFEKFRLGCPFPLSFRDRLLGLTLNFGKFFHGLYVVSLFVVSFVFIFFFCHSLAC